MTHNARIAHIAATYRVGMLRGRILQVDQRPVGNVEVSVGKETARTDANGWFTLVDVPAGRQELYVDGSTANHGDAEYGQFVVGVDIVRGRLNELPYTMYVPRITARDKIAIPSPLTHDVVLKHPDMPGLMVQIPAGTVIRDRKGRLVRELAIVPTPVNRAPFPVADNYPLYFTLEPGGAVIQGLTPASAKGIRIFYPNYDRLPKGTQANFWIYDPSDGWRVYGKGRVTSNGKYISPEAGVALFQTMGGSYSISENDPAPEDNKPPCNESCGSVGSGSGASTGDPIDLRTGQFSYNETDIAITDITPILLNRQYRPNDTLKRVFGIGTTSSYDYKLTVPPGGNYDVMSLVLPAGMSIKFDRVSGYGLDGEWKQRGSTTVFGDATLSFINKTIGHGYLISFRDGSMMHFGNYAPNPLQWTQDRYGNRTEFVYDAGLMTRIVSPSGRYIAIEYDSQNRIKTSRDSMGHAWNYEYDSNGLLSKVIYPDSTFKQYSYVFSHLIDGACPIGADESRCKYFLRHSQLGNPLYQHAVKSIIDQRGKREILNEFEPMMLGWIGRVIKQTQADGGVITIDYQHQDPSLGIGVLVINPDGSKRRIGYEGIHPYPTTDTIGYGTPLAQTFTFERDVYDRLTARIDPLGRRTEYVYDDEGQVIKTTLLSGTSQSRSTSMTYTPDGDLETIRDPLNRVTTLAYTNRCLTSIQDPLGHSTQISCNRAGQPMSVTDANGNTSVLQYQDYDLASISDPLNRSVQFRYDALGRVVATQDAQGNVSRREYDVMGRVKKSYDPQGRITELGYDANGNVTAVLLPNGNGITYGYDDRERVTDRTDSLSQVERWTYDPLDRVKTSTDRKGQVTTTDYDILGRPTLTTYPGTAGSVTATYDAGNRLRTLVDTVSGTLGWDYDAFDQVTQATTPQGNLAYTYDAVNRRRSMIAGSQAAVTYDYDDADLLRKIQQGSEIVTMDYDLGNRITQQVLPNGVKTAYAYNAASQLTGLGWAKADGTVIGDLGYGYDSVGRQVAQAGSFSSQLLPNASTGTNTFDDSNRQTSYNGQTLGYDANGNLTNDGTRTYVWNARDQLTQVKQGSTVVATYAYDALGRRITRSEGGATTSYLYDDLNPVQETQGSIIYPSLTGLGIDQRFARTEGSGRTYLLTDGLGSTKALTNASGSVVNRYDYSPYGETSQTASGFTNPYQYTGRERDTTGLYYYRARYYHPGMSRFISEDPIKLAGGLNAYAYVGGDPILNVDPDGLQFFPYSNNLNTRGSSGQRLPDGVAQRMNLVVGVGTAGAAASVYTPAAVGLGIMSPEAAAAAARAAQQACKNPQARETALNICITLGVCTKNDSDQWVEDVQRLREISEGIQRENSQRGGVVTFPKP